MNNSNKTYFDHIYHKSSESMAELPDGAVALTVTSPPYWNAVDYDRHSKDPEAWYRTRSYNTGFAGYDEYLKWLSGVSREVLRVTKPGGFYAVVIGTVLYEGKHYPVPFHFTERMTAEGWHFHQDIVWNKVTGGVRRAGVLLQHPYPGYYYPNIMTEYILVFRKPGQPIYRGRVAEEKQSAVVETGRLFKNDIANNVWHIAPVPPGHLDHPAPFPEEIPWRLVQLYSYPDEVVLDPFAGSGQTCKVANHLGRRYVGYEVIESYVAYARSRVHEALAVRKQQLLPRYDKVPLNPEGLE